MIEQNLNVGSLISQNDLKKRPLKDLKKNLQDPKKTSKDLKITTTKT